uniref:Uncharacterized protein n=1 Tax=Oryza meridionalis TaxID=40149 RepID=A0A0E0C2F9_9ORYZ
MEKNRWYDVGETMSARIHFTGSNPEFQPYHSRRLFRPLPRAVSFPSSSPPSFLVSYSDGNGGSRALPHGRGASVWAWCRPDSLPPVIPSEATPLLPPILSCPSCFSSSTKTQIQSPALYPHFNLISSRRDGPQSGFVAVVFHLPPPPPSPLSSPQLGTEEMRKEGGAENGNKAV